MKWYLNEESNITLCDFMGNLRNYTLGKTFNYYDNNKVHSIEVCKYDNTIDDLCQCCFFNRYENYDACSKLCLADYRPDKINVIFKEITSINSINSIISKCKELFLNKQKDYGNSWRILRTESLLNQIIIKANRIRSIQNKGVQKIADSIKDDFIGILNYSIMALIQNEIGSLDVNELNLDSYNVVDLYDKYTNKALELLNNKNHDYGDVWKCMTQVSIIDIILVKLLRIKSILDNDEDVICSEGINSNYIDIINYCIFALLLN